MLRDRFDRAVLLGLLVVVAAFGWQLVSSPGESGDRSQAAERIVAQEIAHQARISFLQRVYEPVEELRAAGKSQQALLKLEEIARNYPGEAHGLILRGAILQEMGALEEAIASYVEALQRNSEYVDERSPLSRRTEIGQLVDQGLATLRARARANPGNPSVKAALTNVYYLQSRLAGGCE